MHNKQPRESNFELMRVISMFMIVLWHIIIHGKLIYMTEGATNLAYNLLLCILVVHVNSFVLATGYFQSKSTFSLKKFLRLFFLIWFYRIIIVVLLTSLNLVTVPSSEFIREFFPIGSENYWFINCYLAIYLLSPFLNKLINSLNQSEYRRLLLVSFLLFSIVSFVTNNVTINNNGSNIIHFCFMYLLGAYFRKYKIKDNYHFKNYSREKRQIIFISGFIICALSNFVIIIFAKQLSSYTNPIVKLISSYIVSSQYNYSTPIDVIQSICYFLFFETLTIKSNFINKISSIVLGVYLIHDNGYVCRILYQFLGIDTGNIQNSTSLIYMLLCGILIFICSLMIEFIRNKISVFINNRKIVKNKKQKFYNYISNI